MAQNSYNMSTRGLPDMYTQSRYNYKMCYPFHTQTFVQHNWKLILGAPSLVQDLLL